MSIVYDDSSHCYYATCRINGRVFMGFSPSRKESIEFCLELVSDKEKS